MASRTVRSLGRAQLKAWSSTQVTSSGMLWLRMCLAEPKHQVAFPPVFGPFDSHSGFAPIFSPCPAGFACVPMQRSDGSVEVRWLQQPRACACGPALWALRPQQDSSQVLVCSLQTRVTWVASHNVSQNMEGSSRKRTFSMFTLI